MSTENSKANILLLPFFFPFPFPMSLEKIVPYHVHSNKAMELGVWRPRCGLGSAAGLL